MVNPTLCFYLVTIVIGVFFFILSSSSQPIRLDKEASSKKSNCYHDIDRGLWGEMCRASTIKRENCALQCLSPLCYDIFYQNDPLEEGERDFHRGHEFLYCMRRVRKQVDNLVVHNVKGSYTIKHGRPYLLSLDEV